MQKKTLKITFVIRHPFPKGEAQSNRLVSISRGLSENGAEVKVLIIKPTEPFGNDMAEGEHLGVSFCYTAGKTTRVASGKTRIIDFTRGIIKSIRIILKEKQKRNHVLVLGVMPVWLQLLYVLICKLKKIKVIQERSEFPFIGLSNSFYDKAGLFIYKNIVCRLFFGIVVINKALRDYFSSFTGKNKPFYILPMMVEPEKFLNGKRIVEGDYIAYCGSMAGEKDGINDLIKAFTLIVKQFPEIKLLLIGSTSFPGFEALKKKTENPDVKGKVIFTGRVAHSEMVNYLKFAKILLLARPANIQAKGGFPTKLGEYLATGNPVVVTRVGEIPDYLEHEKNAMLAEPGNPVDFTAQVLTLLQDQDFAGKIGAAGQKLTQETFNYKVQTKKLLYWLEEHIL